MTAAGCAALLGVGFLPVDISWDFHPRHYIYGANFALNKIPFHRSIFVLITPAPFVSPF